MSILTLPVCGTRNMLTLETAYFLKQALPSFLVDVQSYGQASYRIALSRTESKYIALSSATRDLLPRHQILTNINSRSFITLPKQSSSTIKQST
jgi:hypothetical protein